MPELADVLDDVDLVDLAGESSYFRGVAYAEEGRAALKEVDAQRVVAVVQGTEPYRVVLTASGKQHLEWSCTCPVGDSGAFCKHAVAVALTVTGAAAESTERTVGDDVDIATYVMSLDPTRLAAIVLDQAARDWRLAERLTAEARAALGLDVDEAVWRKRVDAAFRRWGRFVDYRTAPDWAAGVFELLDALDELLATGHADVVITLAERCHRKAEAAIAYVDDSDGYITDIFHRVADLHLAACTASRPAPVPLARRLAKLELTAELDTFHRAASRYADVLGADGLAAYRKVVEPKWDALVPGGDRWSHDEFRIRQAMIGLALASGDPDELIRVKEHDLRSPYDHVEIVEFLRVAGRRDDALTWARAGLTQFAGRPHQLGTLRDVTAELLREEGDPQAAVDVYADAFAHDRTIDAYRKLLQAAEGAGVAEERRAAAHELVASDPRASEVQVAMLLHDGDVEAAWLAATVHGCSPSLWLALARARETEHPLDVIPVYVTEIEREIDTKKKAGYQRAVKTLAHVERLADAGHAPDRFTSVLANVRTRHRQKRSLMELLDRRGWPT
ncbi:MAG TPA: SWIM zinc finger family protein [Acidimicrobiia bacterium]|jgi:uncharacterized Zn finger protein|nr:SWIM zinc finger family protein [Acidimicrobiia bacterium]